MNKLCCLLLSSVMCLAVSAVQAETCAQANWLLNTQSQVDFLGSLNCTRVDGDLTITGSSITSLSALSQLTSLGGDLDIAGNDSLLNLSGLGSMTSISGNLNIGNNAAMESICALENVTEVGGDLSVTSNGYLRNGYYDAAYCSWDLSSVGGDIVFEDNIRLQELGFLRSLTVHSGSLTIRNSAASLSNFQHGFSLTSVGGDLVIESNGAENLYELRNLNSVGGSLLITGNNLDSLEDLIGLVSVGGSLTISSNDLLRHVGGLVNLQTVGGSLTVQDNLSLNDCLGLVPLLEYPNGPGNVAGAITFANNDTGCNSISDIFSSVQAPGQPILTGITAGDGSITLSASVPDAGTFPVTGLRGTCTDEVGSSFSSEGGASSVKVTGLSNGTPYTCTVVALSDGGESIPSGESIPVTPSERPEIDPAILWFITKPALIDEDSEPDSSPTDPSVPGTPLAVTVRCSSEVVDEACIINDEWDAWLRWLPPEDDGGSAITGYRIQVNRPSTWATWETLIERTDPAVTNWPIGGLNFSSGSYQFRVAAHNEAGVGPFSAPSDYIALEFNELTLASACNGVPANVRCDKTVIPEDFYQVWRQEIVQPASQILSMPFIVEASTQAEGRITVKSFMSAIDAAASYEFIWWISDHINGSALHGNPFCVSSDKGVSALHWTQSNPGYGECGLGSTHRILYVNTALRKTNPDGSESLYPYDYGSRAAAFTLSNSTSVAP